MRHIGFTAICLLAVALAWVIRDHWSPSSTPNVSAELASLRAQVKQMERRADRDHRRTTLFLERALENTASPPPDPPGRETPVLEQFATGEAAVDGDDSLSRASSSPRDRVEGELARHEAWFASDAADATWASGAESSVTGELREALGPDDELKSVECRGVVCRAEVSHSDDPARQEFVSRWLVPQEHRWPGERMLLQNFGADGAATIAFYARVGHSFE